MNPTFHANLPRAYESIERLLNGFRDGFEDKGLLAILDEREKYVVETPETWQPKKQDDNMGLSESRAVYCLGQGYAVKIRLFKAGRLRYGAYEFIHNRNQEHMEEDSVRVLRKYRFTQENGFWVPEHKVIGVHFIDGRIRVNPMGYGVTITEDLTEDGQYRVVDITPDVVDGLVNRDKMLEEYQRHKDALLALYHNPAIEPTVNRHAKPNDPEESIRRMMLVRIKDNIGELVIGDLDNLVFDEVNTQPQ